MNLPEANGSAYALSIYGNARRIEWEGDFPADLRAIVEPLAAPLEPLIPMWCQTFCFRYSPDLPCTLQIEASIRNRWAVLRVGPGWFSHPAAEREDALIHEMVHLLIEPYQWPTARALEAYGPPEGEAGHAYLQQSLSDGLEQAVEDLARAFHKVILASRA